MSIPYPASRWGGMHAAVGRLLHWADASAFAKALAAADVVEGCEPTTHAKNNLYHRHLCHAWSLDGTQWRPHAAWVYVFARDVTAGEHWTAVPSNDWLFRQAAPISLALETTEAVVPAAVASSALRVAACMQQQQQQPQLAHSSGEEQLSPPVAVLPGALYISSERQAQSISCLRAAGVTHVVSLTEGPLAPACVHSLHLPGPDDATASLQQYIVHAVPYIEEVLSGAAASAAAVPSGEKPVPPPAVLVHCSAGISRSASLVLLHLMRCAQLPLARAWLHLRGVKPNVQPTLHFMRQLCQWEEDWTGGRTVQWQTYALLSAVETVTGWAADQHMEADTYAELLGLPPAAAEQMLPSERQVAWRGARGAAESRGWDMQHAMHDLLQE